MQWRVRDVMTSDVIAVPEDALVTQVASLLTERQISAVAVVDRYDTVTGVVSWTDLRDTVRTEEAGDDATGRWRPWRFARLRWPETRAVDVMSAPAVTIPPEVSLATAGRLMRHRRVGRLLVVDARRRLLGIVTRSDLLKVHDRLDAVIRAEVTQRVLQGGLGIPAGDVRVEVDGGLVTLAGRTERRTTAMAAVAMTALVAGVTDVVDLITYDVDDVPSAPEPPTPDAPPAGWQQNASIPVNRARRLRHPGFDHNVAAYGEQRRTEDTELT